MTEAEWLACADPEPMLDTLLATGSVRKILLFGTACCRRVDHYFRTAGGGRAIEVAYRYADGAATAEERAAALAGLNDGSLVGSAVRGERLEHIYSATGSAEAASSAVMFVLYEPPWEMHPILRSKFAADKAAYAVQKARRSHRRERAAQADLVRDIVSNPFRPVALDPAWLTSTVAALACGIYTDHAFDRLPIMADALEEAGCDNADILAHCRGPGPHVRGCWIIDLVLGKK